MRFTPPPSIASAFSRWSSATFSFDPLSGGESCGVRSLVAIAIISIRYDLSYIGWLSAL